MFCLLSQVNHHFTKNCTFFREIEHPRWGMIQSVAVNEETANKLNVGDELFGYYDYQWKEFPFDFPWYFELKSKVEAEQERRKLKQEIQESTMENKDKAKNKEEQKGTYLKEQRN